MRTQVPPRHPLRQLFGALTEKSFTEHLGWPDLNVTSYLSNLLVDFTHTDQLYKIRNQQDRPVDTVVTSCLSLKCCSKPSRWIVSGTCISISGISRSSWRDCFLNICAGSRRPD